MKEKKNLTSNQKKNQSTKNDPGMTEMMTLENLKTSITNI